MTDFTNKLWTVLPNLFRGMLSFPVSHLSFFPFSCYVISSHSSDDWTAAWTDWT